MDLIIKHVLAETILIMKLHETGNKRNVVMDEKLRVNLLIMD